VQLGKELYIQFIAMCSEGKPVTVLRITGTVKSSYDKMKIMDRCTFSQGSIKNYLEELRSIYILFDNLALVL
jgi:hypothetical protein